MTTTPSLRRTASDTTRVVPARSRRLDRDPQLKTGASGRDRFAGSSGSPRWPTAGAGWRRRLVTRLVLGDAAGIIAVLLLALEVGGGGLVDRLVGGAVLGTAAVGVLLLLVLLACGAYRTELLGAGTQEYRRVAAASLVGVGLLALALVLVEADVRRTFLAVLLVATGPVLLGGRLVQRLLLARARVGGRHTDRAVLIGTPEEVTEVAARLRRGASSGYRVHAVATGQQDTGWFELPDGTSVLQWGRAEAVLPAIAAGQADVVVVAGPSRLSPAAVRDLAHTLEATGTPLVLTGALRDVADHRIRQYDVGGLPMVSMSPALQAGLRVRLKRVLDVVGAGAALLLLSPVLVVVTLAVLIGSGRPVLFRQVRVGVDGMDFRMTKFRSMVSDAEARRATLKSDRTDSPLFKMVLDPRVTPVGRILRRWSLDELPQLLDVLRGDMSLVGPRPALPKEVATYPDLVRRRLRVKPGLTGPSQVSGRSDLGWDEAVRLDVAYVENWSLAGDVALLARTVRAVVSGRGAY